MKHVIRIAVASISLAFIAGCTCSSHNTCAPAPKTAAADMPAARPPRPASNLPSLDSHLAPDWISAATRVQCGDSVIYYHGSAQRNSPDDEAWTGTAQGDILYLSPQRAILIPSGALTLIQGNRFKVAGPSQTVLARPTETPKWRKLLTT